jgi:hypothetical protein
MRIRLLLFLAAAAAADAVLSAATPTFWQISTQAEFLRGDVENLSIDSDGRLLLGPANELVHETTAPFLWVLLPAPDGGVYVGSGNEGKVFRVDAAGKGDTFFDATELEVHALAPAPGDAVYVGTSPDGKVYKVASNGSSDIFFDPEEKYIWALAVAPDGSVYVATGDKGIIYRVGRDGKGEPFYRTRATHVTALALDGAGNLLAGTESPGKIFRIDRQGKAFVLLDTSFREIHALRVDGKGVVYAAALSGRAPSAPEPREPERVPEPSRPAPVPTVSTEITSIAILDVGGPPSPPERPARRDERRARGAVYRITPDGSSDVVWESDEDSPYDVLVEADGGLIVGTGGRGKIFRVSGEPMRATLLSRAAAQQVTMFARDPRQGIFYATANPGKLFRLSPRRAEQGLYESEVRDAETVAGWGTMRWRAQLPPGTQLLISTRSGNTATPDDTWSAWSAPYRNADGEQITSPKARYLQWKALFSGRDATPILTSVTAAYLQRNLRPVVDTITVHPPGTAFQKPFSTGELEIAGLDSEDAAEGRNPSSTSATSSAAAGQPAGAPALGRRVYQKGLQTFVWKASDDNDDRLQYDVMYRREGEVGWKVLRRGLWDEIFVWDTTSVPDGSYLVKVVASDAPSNSPGTALTGDRESSALDIDNTPPQIEVGAPRTEAGRTILPFTVHDGHSPVQRAEFSLDANRWRVIYPKDGIADSRIEEFEIALDAGTQVASVIIRITDAMNNTATAIGAR